MTHDKANAFRSRMLRGNDDYLNGLSGDVSPERRTETARCGQSPHAVVLTCCDSRLHVNRIFSADIGDLFTIRTAGHVVGDFVLGSIEYGVRVCGAGHILVLGHKKCGAVNAAVSGDDNGGYIDAVVREIKGAIAGETDPDIAVRTNIRHSMTRLLQSPYLSECVRNGTLLIHGAVFDIETGRVHWLDGS